MTAEKFPTIAPNTYKENQIADRFYIVSNHFLTGTHKPWKNSRFFKNKIENVTWKSILSQCDLRPEHSVNNNASKNLIEVLTIECLRNANRGSNFRCLYTTTVLIYFRTNLNPFVG